AGWTWGERRASTRGSTASAAGTAVEVFVSSRRRHTRLVSDWSSDVCSSDLARRPAATRRPLRDRDLQAPSGCRDQPPVRARRARSEERRVGKEWRCRGVPGHYKKRASGEQSEAKTSTVLSDARRARPE